MMTFAEQMQIARKLLFCERLNTFINGSVLMFVSYREVFPDILLILSYHLISNFFCHHRENTVDLFTNMLLTISTRFTFYDGPPFATGLPHYGHILAGTIKDIVTRFAHQSGFHVDRRFGWDCHGLPVVRICLNCGGLFIFILVVFICLIFCLLL